MTRTLLRLALLAAFAAPAAGAQAAGAAYDAQAAKPKLDAELGEHFKGIELTEAQIRQVTEIKAKHHKAMDELRKKSTNHDDAAFKAEIKKHMDAEHAEFTMLLTPEQKKKFEENMKGHHAPAAEGHAMDHSKKPEMKKPEPKKP